MITFHHQLHGLKKNFKQRLQQELIPILPSTLNDVISFLSKFTMTEKRTTDTERERKVIADILRELNHPYDNHLKQIKKFCSCWN